MVCPVASTRQQSVESAPLITNSGIRFLLERNLTNPIRFSFRWGAAGASPLAAAAAVLLSCAQGLRSADCNQNGVEDAADLRSQNFRFSASPSYPVGANPWSLIATDLDGDGKADLATVEGNGVSVLLNLRDGTFKIALSYPAGGGSLIAADLSDHGLYRTDRWFSEDEVLPPAYRLPLPRGSYLVTLHFAELGFRAPGRRRFDVRLEGTEVLKDHDPITKGGYAAADPERFRSDVEDGMLDIEFVHRVEDPAICAIEIERGD